MSQIKLLLIAVIGLWSVCGLANAKVINCYYQTRSLYHHGDGLFEPYRIDPSLCTHLSYSFFGMSPEGEIQSLERYMDYPAGRDSIRKVMALKQINPNLKVIVVVGGWNDGSVKYSEMAANPQRRQLFTTSSLKFIKEHGFDGLDLDWEYPEQEDKANLVTLLKELREAFKPHNLQLSITAGASANTALSYDIPNIAKYLDYINVKTFEFATAGVLSFNAPLTGQGKNNVESAIKYWLKEGAPASKLVLGVTFHGGSFEMSRYQQSTPGSRSSKVGPAGPFLKENGVLGYNEICVLLGLASNWNNKWADKYGVPYSYLYGQWIGYDNVQSINLKMDFLNSLDLAGAMAWSIDTDDFLGTCGESYPLLKAINKKLSN